MKNPHKPETPEWQLFESMKSAELAAIAFDADVTRYQQKAADMRNKAIIYREALEKLK